MSHQKRSRPERAGLPPSAATHLAATAPIPDRTQFYLPRSAICGYCRLMLEIPIPKKRVRRNSAIPPSWAKGLPGDATRTPEGGAGPKNISAVVAERMLPGLYITAP